MGVHKTTEHESGYFEEDEEDDLDMKVKKESRVSSDGGSDISFNNNRTCDAAVSDCSEDIFFSEEECISKCNQTKGKTL